MGIPASEISANFPNTRTKPLGTTVLYSNQKSNKSPNRYIAAASFLISSNQEVKYFSRARLSAGFGKPKWLSDAKYIFLFFGSSIREEVTLTNRLIQIFNQILNVLYSDTETN